MTEQIRIIAVDPGGTTGLVVVRPDLTIEASMEIPDWYDVPKYIEDMYILHDESGIDPPFVVCERFFITGQTHKKTPQEEPKDIIGALKYLHRKYTGLPLPLQSPSDAKSFSTNDKLHKVGFWHIGGAGHANDAFRHALLFMFKRQMVSSSILLD